MTRLAIATVILAIALVVTRRKLKRRPGADTLRVTSRTSISRGVMAAVLETEDRRFLVTITASSTTVVAELGASEAPAFPAALAAALPQALAAQANTAAAPVIAAQPPTAPTAPVTPVAPAAPAAAPAPARPATPALHVPTFAEADAAVAHAGLPRRPAGQPSAIAAAVADEQHRRSLLDRARARTVRNYDLDELASTKPGR
jgi:hypothetical protein